MIMIIIAVAIAALFAVGLKLAAQAEADVVVQPNAVPLPTDPFADHSPGCRCNWHR